MGHQGASMGMGSHGLGLHECNPYWLIGPVNGLDPRLPDKVYRRPVAETDQQRLVCRGLGKDWTPNSGLAR